LPPPRTAGGSASAATARGRPGPSYPFSCAGYACNRHFLDFDETYSVARFLDLVFGRDAPAEVFPAIADWLHVRADGGA
jgi:hypothetical protein